MAADDGEIDLHGKTVQEAMEAFLSYYNERVLQGNLNKIEVVHGYGSTGEGGYKIRDRLRGSLSNHPDKVSYDPGRFHGNPWDATTVVYPKKYLPTKKDRLEEQIIAFCATPKSEEKLMNKFRSHSDLNVRQTLAKLVREKSLFVRKGRLKEYSDQP